MKSLKKLGLGLINAPIFVKFAVFTVFFATSFFALGTQQSVGAQAYIVGDNIKYRDTIYTNAGVDTRTGRSTSGFTFYLPPDFSCGDRVIVDNPAPDHPGVALRTTIGWNGANNPVIGDCWATSLSTVLSEIDCYSTGGAWIGGVVGCSSGATAETPLDLITADTESACNDAGATWTNGSCDLSQARDPDADADGGQVADTCESRSPGWGWLMCSGIDLIDSGINWVDNQIQRLLEVNRDRYTNEGLRSAWGTFRNIAYIILIPVMLVMVIGTAIGVDAFSAYTVRKALPRMVAAIIFIALSWYICVFLIGFFNAVGSGVNGLITAPFRQEIGAYDPACAGGSLNLTCLYSNDPEVAGGAGILRGIATTAAQVGTILGLAVFLALFGTTLLIAAGSAFIVLFAREMFILGLMLVAPLAILAWIFPGNDKLWKGWWGIFSKLLMMYPLIMGIIAVGRIFAWIIDQSAAGALEGSLLKPIMKLVAYLLPYALIPFTFKFAGGVFANLAGIVNDKNRGLFDRAKKGREDKLQRWGNRGMFKTDTGVRGKVNTATKAAMNVKEAGVNPMHWRRNMGRTLSGKGINRADEMMEDKDYSRWKGNDTLNMWAALSKNETELKKLLEESGDYERDAKGNLTADGRKNMNMDLSSARQLRERYGNDAFRQATFVSAMAGGTALDKEQKVYRRDRATGQLVRDASGNLIKDKKVFSAAKLQAEIAGSDRAVQASLVAKGRSAAGQSGRNDQAGISFGDGLGEQAKFRNGVIDTYNGVEEVVENGVVTGHRQVSSPVQFEGFDDEGKTVFSRTLANGSRERVDSRKVTTEAAVQGDANARTYTTEESVHTTRHRVYERQGAFSIVHPQQKDTTVEHVVPVMMEEVERSLDAVRDVGLRKANADGTVQNADQARVEFVGKMASVKALQDSLGSTSPLKAAIVQREATSKTIDVSRLTPEIKNMLAPALAPRQRSDGTTYTPTEITYSEALEAIEGNGEFQQFRKEFKSQFDRHATASPEEQALRMQQLAEQQGESFS